MVLTFVLWTIIFCLQKPIFLLIYSHVSQVFPVMWHGLQLDMAMAGYLTALPALCLLVGDVLYWLMKGPALTVHGQHVMRIITSLYFWVTAVAVAMSFVANLALYGYWLFPLDSTPIFFITSSPRDAMASVPWWQGLLAVVVIAAVTWLIHWAFMRLYSRVFKPRRTLSYARPASPVRWPLLIVEVLLVAALFLPIRGGVTVSTVNTGWAYFSQDQTLNHAAVNPLFSFMESMSHQEDFGNQYRYMDDGRAHQLAAACNRPTGTSLQRAQWVAVNRPDVYLVIMESFSDTVCHAMASDLRGRQVAVTPCMNQQMHEGLYFSRFYANSFRTDRGLVSILLGYPSPATFSLMKYPKKTEQIPAFPAHMKAASYDMRYFYGGDADFTNMRSFLISQGFSKIIEDVDFPVSERLSKWGVPDHLLFQNAKKTLAAEHASQQPRLWVIQTSSSHEPFDVPFHRLADKKLNAFAYADSCVGDFVHQLKVSGRWNRSLVILVPDHLGAWPENADNFKPWRYHIPLIWTGGALAAAAKGRTVTTWGSQQDIAATLLGQLGIGHQDMVFSKDMASPAVAHYAFFMPNDGFGLVDEKGCVVYDHKLGKVVYQKGASPTPLIDYGKALVQVLFDDIARR